MKVNGTLEKAQLETTSRTAADDRIPGMVWRDEVDGQAKYDDGTEIKTLSTEDENLGRNAILSGNTDSLHGDTRESDYPNFLRPAGIIRPQDGTRVLGGMLVASPATPLRLRIANEAVEITQNENIAVALPAVSDRGVRLQGVDILGDLPIPNTSLMGNPDYAYYDRGGRVRKGEVPLAAGATITSGETEVIGRELYASATQGEFRGMAQCEPAGDRLKNLERANFVNNQGRLLGNLESGRGPRDNEWGLEIRETETTYNRYYRHRVFVILAADGTTSAEAILGQYTEQEERPDPTPLSNGEIWYRPSTQEYFIRGLTGTTPDWLPSKRILIGYLISAQRNTTVTPNLDVTTFAAQSVPWTRAYSAENDIEIEFADAVYRVVAGGNVSVWGNKFNVKGLGWNNVHDDVADFDAIEGIALSNVLEVSLCITEKGERVVSLLAPVWSDEFKCFIVPGRSWRAVGRGEAQVTDVAAKQVTLQRITRGNSFIWERFALHGRIPLTETIVFALDGRTLEVESQGPSIREVVINDATTLPDNLRQDLTGGTSATINGLVILNFIVGWLEEAPDVELVNGVDIAASATQGGEDVIRALLLHLPSGLSRESMNGTIIYVVRALAGQPTPLLTPTGIVQVPHTLRISRGARDAAQAELDNSLKVRV